MITKDLNVCLLPLEIKWGDKEVNLNTLKEAMAQVHPDTDLVILPETFSTGFPVGMDKEAIRPYAERNTGATIDLLKELAHKYNVAIAGSYIADSGGSLYNRGFFIEPSGDESFADKKHLFTMGGEDKIFSKGHTRMSVRYRGWNIAMVICYDLRFPVWCRNINNQYDMMCVVANWPIPRVNVWSALLPARAIENSAYVCAVNCFGKDTSGVEYDGKSAVIDFKGKWLGVEAQTNIPGAPLFIYATLQRDALEKFRKKFPVGADADAFELKD